MKKFDVTLTETVKYFAEIEAETLEEAMDIAMKMAEDSSFPNGEQELVEGVIEGRGSDESYLCRTL